MQSDAIVKSMKLCGFVSPPKFDSFKYGFYLQVTQVCQVEDCLSRDFSKDSVLPV